MSHSMVLTGEQVEDIIEQEMQMLLDLLAVDDDRSCFESEEERSDLVRAAQVMLGWYGTPE